MGNKHSRGRSASPRKVSSSRTPTNNEASATHTEQENTRGDAKDLGKEEKIEAAISLLMEACEGDKEEAAIALLEYAVDDDDVVVTTRAMLESLHSVIYRYIRRDFTAPKTIRQTQPGSRLGAVEAAVDELGSHLNQTFCQISQMQQLASRINEGLLMEDCLQYIFDNFRDLIPYNRIGCALYNAEKHELTARWCRSDAKKVYVPLGFRCNLTGSSLEPVLRSGRPRILNDLPAYSAAKPSSYVTKLIIKEGGRSSLTCPLISEGRPVGVLFFTSFREHAYAQAHVDVFQTLASHISASLEKSVVMGRLAAEQRKSEQLLDSLLPPTISERLKGGENVIADDIACGAVLFADVVGFTTWSSQRSAHEVVAVLSGLFRDLDASAARLGVEKIKTIGDCYMAASGVLCSTASRPLSPVSRAMGIVFPGGSSAKIIESGSGSGSDSSAAVPEAKSEASSFAETTPRDVALNADAAAPTTLQQQQQHIASLVEFGLSMPATFKRHGLRCRVGVHCGSVTAGVIGADKLMYDLWGDTVNTASRMESHGLPDRVHVSDFLHTMLTTGGAVDDAAAGAVTGGFASKFAWEDRGEITVKGKGQMRTWFVDQTDAAASAGQSNEGTEC